MLASFPLSPVLLAAALLSAPALVADIPSPGPGAASPCCAPPDAAQDLAKKLVVVPSHRRRDELLDEFVTLVRTEPSARSVLVDALVELWRTDHVAIDKRSYLRAFDGLLEARGKLDGLRAKVLAIVRDESAYPYPHVAGEADPDSTARHTLAQARIEDGLEAIEDLVESTRPARLSPRVRRHLERIFWTRRAVRRLDAEIGLEVALPDVSVPAWVYGLPIDVADVEVPVLALGLSIEEGEGLAVDRAIRRRNAEVADGLLVAARGDEDAQERIRLEAEQVRLTNEYRAMLGLHRLGWSAEMHAACRHHSDFLHRTGTIGHMQPEPENATFQLRGRNAGYPNVLFENCTVGPERPLKAHAAFVRSSAHHRTVLHPGVTEMATGITGVAWVQNYGLDSGFRSGIQCPPWRD